MDFEVTANRKRPQNLSSLAGQEFVVETLKRSIDNSRIAHAYLFSGPRGVGKTSAARILARSLNCEKGPTSQPCGTCSHCLEIAKGRSLDVIEIDGASNTSVNDVREIKDEVLFAPNSSKYKIYIIDEVHMLSNSAFNALLKTIEEPPPYIVFIFATTEIHKVPATIRSRCQQFNFRLISLEIIQKLLKSVCDESSINYEDDALLWIAKEATGSLRDAYTLFDQVVSFSDGFISLEKIREKLGLIGLDQINELAELFVEEKAMDALIKTDDILSTGISLEQFVIELSDYFRNVLFIISGISNESVLGAGLDRYSPKVLKGFISEQVEYALHLIHQLFRDIRYSVNPRYELDLLISKLSALSRYITRESMLAEILSLKQQILTGESSSPMPVGYQDKKKSLNNSENPFAGRGVISPRLQTEADNVSAEQQNSSDDVPEHKEAVPEEKTHPVPRIVNDDPDEYHKRIIAAIKRENRSLAATLEKATGWHFSKDDLNLFFKSKFDVATVQDHIKLLKQILFDISAFQGKIHVRTMEDKEEKQESGVSLEKVKLVQRVFKGKIMKMNKYGELKDEY